MQSRRSFLGHLPGLSLLAALDVPAASPPVLQTRRLEVLLFDRREDWEFLPPDLSKALAALGWLDGTNLRIRWHFASGDEAMLSTLVETILRSQPDAILTRGTPATLALQRATTTIPIVTGLGDPDRRRLRQELCRAWRQHHGRFLRRGEANRKRVELLRALVPELATLLILLPTHWKPFSSVLLSPIESAAREVGLATRTAVSPTPPT